MNKTLKARLKKEIKKDFLFILNRLNVYPTILEVLFEDDHGFDGEDNAIGVVIKVPYNHVQLHVPSSCHVSLDVFMKNRDDFRDTLIHEALHILTWEAMRLGEKRYVTQEQLE